MSNMSKTKQERFIKMIKSFGNLSDEEKAYIGGVVQGMALKNEKFNSNINFMEKASL